MKSQNASQRGKGAGRRSPPIRIPQIPMEWMDPMSWRLPSGKALAEFALQAGFLAPLMLGTPAFKKRKKKAEPPAAVTGVKAEVVNAASVKAAAVKAAIEKQIREVPEHSGTFRQTR
jgi:hypothetical protein